MEEKGSPAWCVRLPQFRGEAVLKTKGELGDPITYVVIHFLFFQFPLFSPSLVKKKTYKVDINKRMKPREEIGNISKTRDMNLMFLCVMK